MVYHCITNEISHRSQDRHLFVQCNDLFHGPNMFDATRANFQGVTPKTLDDRFYDFTRIIHILRKDHKTKHPRGLSTAPLYTPRLPRAKKWVETRHQTWCFCRDHGLRKGLNVTTGCSNLGSLNILGCELPLCGSCFFVANEGFLVGIPEPKNVIMI